MSVRTQPLTREQKQQLRAEATEESVRAAIAEYGRSEAVDLYGHNLVLPLLSRIAHDSDTGS
jgi:hypothetical protein